MDLGGPTYDQPRPNPSIRVQPDLISPSWSWSNVFGLSLNFQNQNKQNLVPPWLLIQVYRGKTQPQENHDIYTP